MSEETWGAAAMVGFLRLMQMREAIASVALSHHLIQPGRTLYVEVAVIT